MTENNEPPANLTRFVGLPRLRVPQGKRGHDQRPDLQLRMFNRDDQRVQRGGLGATLMRGPAIWAGVVFASVCVAQPATAQQMTFLQCGYDWSNGNHTDKVFAIHGSALLVWNPGAGDFLNACDPRDSFGATGASCIAIIGDYEITITTRTTSGFSMNLSIDRTTGRFQEFMPTSGLSAQGKCSRGADPRVAPRAF